MHTPIQTSLTTVFLVCSTVVARPTAAQDASEAFEALARDVEIGIVIFVEDDSGRRLKGKLEELSDSTIAIRTEGAISQRHRFETASVTKVTKVDSRWSGFLIGAVAGAVPGILLARGINTYCGNEGPSCPGGATVLASLIAAAGGWIGWEIDGAIDGETPVYERRRQPPTRPTSVTPVVGLDGAGLVWTLAF